MPLESANFISDLNVANPSSTDSVAQADDHIRLIKAAIKATFPNVTGQVTATHTALNSPLPSGIIVMWSGAVAPTGWSLCDGTAGTPDLRNRFIVGASTTYPLATTGGNIASSAAGSHTHTEASAGGHDHGGNTGGTALTLAQLPAHTHTWSGTSTSEDNNYTAGATKYLKEASTANNAAFTETTSSVGSGEAHNHTIATEAAHTHTINSVGDHTHSVTPPYYALAYIMKI